MNTLVQKIDIIGNYQDVVAKQRGFTIVELLIVIVIIGILAALVIVGYTGITARANAVKAKTNAVAIQKKAEAYAADAGGGSYPTLITQFTGAIAGLPTGVTLRVSAGAALSNSNGTTVIEYRACNAGAGYQVYYWDFAASTPASTLGASGGTTSSCAVPAS